MENTFKEYLKEARQRFCKEVNKHNVSDNLQLRTECDSFLIAFDQAVDKAINFTGSSLELKEKYSEDFEYFVQKKVKEQKLSSIYWYNEISFFNLDSLFEYYQRMIKPLIT